MRQISILRNVLKVKCCLDCKLTCWGQYQTPSTNNFAVALKFFYDWNAERSSLTTTCSGHCNYIEALKDDWNRSPLNRCWQVITLLLDSLEQIR